MNQCDIIIVGSDIVNYEEAKEYYGEELCNLLIKAHDIKAILGFIFFKNSSLDEVIEP